MSILGKKYGPDVIFGVIAVAIFTANLLATKIIIVFIFAVPVAIVIYSIGFYLAGAKSEFIDKKSNRNSNKVKDSS